MKHGLLLALLLSTLHPSVFGQYRQRELKGYTVFTIPFPGEAPRDSITFAVVAKPGELTKKKPIFLFRQGSRAIPLFTIDAKTNQPELTELPRSCHSRKEGQYSIMIAKPGVPLIGTDAYLDTLFSNNPQSTMSATYLAHNYLDQYVQQTNAVLAFVLKRSWADAKRVVLAGGSEGYQVAIKTAYTNRNVTHLIGLSGNLEGRHQSQIRRARMAGYSGEVTQEEAQKNVEDLQNEWAEICRDSLNVSGTTGDPNRTTYSFSHGQNLTYLLSLTIPIYVAYGGADVGSTSNDILPLEFARRGKTNLTLRVYPNHDHTFHKLTYGPDHKVVKQEYNGVAVEKDYFEWLRVH